MGRRLERALLKKVLAPSSVHKGATFLECKTVVVVGGSSGIGFGVAQAALEHGAKVVVASSSQAKVDAAVRRLQAVEGVSSESVSGVAVSAKDEKALEKFWDGVGKIDHMVWTAGDVPSTLSASGGDSDGHVSRAWFDVRYWGSSLSAKYLQKRGLLNPGGSITLTSGVNGDRPTAGWWLGVGVVGAMDAVTRALAVDLAPIRVNCVSPGAVETELYDTMIPAPMRAVAVQKIAERSLVKHVGTPQEIAEAYLFCMKCGFFTGQIVKVEGGALLC